MPLQLIKLYSICPLVCMMTLLALRGTPHSWMLLWVRCWRVGTVLSSTQDVDTAIHKGMDLIIMP